MIEQRHRFAKIIATIGPQSSDFSTIENLFLNGVDVFRLNFSHGTHNHHSLAFESIRKIENKHQCPIAVVGDLQGPKFRIGEFNESFVSLKENQTFDLCYALKIGDHTKVGLPHPELFTALHEGDFIYLRDGLIKLQIIKKDDDILKTRVLNHGDLGSKQGVNVPGVYIPLNVLTPKDHEDLEFALALGVDWIALSFVQIPKDVQQAKTLIQDKAKIIVKLEKPKAIQSLEHIVKISDAIMIARGDLGIEIPPENVPIVQRQIIRTCRRLSKPVIVATQMLESMTHSPSPTRAEVSDVATAIYEGVDGVMLSGETAMGEYPLKAAEMMDKIIKRVEQDPLYKKNLHHMQPKLLYTISDSMAAAAREISSSISVSVIIPFTETGDTAIRISTQRPSSAILSLTPSLKTSRFLAMIWGIRSVMINKISAMDDMIYTSHTIAKKLNYVQLGDLMTIVAGMPFGQAGMTNLIRIEKCTTE
jgi:pyruvate kinase